MKVATQAIRTSASGKTTVRLQFAKDNGIVLGLSAVHDRAHINLSSYMRRKAEEVESYMKSNHPWQNRTGRAERGLHTAIEENISDGRSRIHIGLYHDEGTWYWRHLEYGMGRRFSIIEPTQRIYGPKLLDELDLFELYRFAGNPKR